MKKSDNSEFVETYSQRQMATIAHWKKLRAEGKWLWIFKRGATWLATMLFIYGLGALLYPAVFNFQSTQFYILFGMLGGFIISSIMEWSKMETAFQQAEKFD